MRFMSLLLFFVLLAVPARADAVDDALEGAFSLYEAVYPGLAATEAGIDTAAYRDALTLGRFTSPEWGTPLRLDVVRGNAGGACSRFAAYVDLPPANGAVRLVVCPEFFESGTPELRRLTVLHEMVHAVAGPDECRAMAFAARIEQLGTGTHTPVDRYWRANGCTSSAFRLP
jgi:hypothetical protein